MKLAWFGVEEWLNPMDSLARVNLGSSCVSALRMDELFALTGQDLDAFLEKMRTMSLHYHHGDATGSPRIKKAVAGIYPHGNVTPDQVMMTHGGTGANELVIMSVLEPGDNCVVVKPSYQQHYDIPKGVGVETREVQLRAEADYRLDLDEVEAACDGRTKLISLTNPNNPIGVVLEGAELARLVEIARAHDTWLLCDEVYRGLTHQGDPYGPSVADLYEKGISTGSMSKVYSLAGLRLGWIAGSGEQGELRERLNRQRDYHIISVGRLDDLLAAVALESREAISRRNLAICRENAAILEDFVQSQPRISYVKPQGGTTAFLKYDLPMASADLCRKLQAETGVMLLPGSALDVEGYLRIGYCNATPVLREGLEVFDAWLNRQ